MILVIFRKIIIEEGSLEFYTCSFGQVAENKGYIKGWLEKTHTQSASKKDGSMMVYYENQLILRLLV